MSKETTNHVIKKMLQQNCSHITVASLTTDRNQEQMTKVKATPDALGTGMYVAPDLTPYTERSLT
jgi:hypothetical protein